MNLVLNHGIFGFASLHGITYFNGIKRHLESKFPELRILAAQVPPAGTIEVRGAALGKQILKALEPGEVFDPDKPAHVIAHSMGGLDARFLLSPDNPENLANRIVSLTTISTPHKGSPIADLLVRIADPLNIGNKENLLAETLRARLASAGIEVGGLRNLTTEGVRRFNSQFRDNDRTIRFSVAGVGRRIKVGPIRIDTCMALGLAYRLIKEKTGEDNDGLVALGSAAWGMEPELWSADHADEIGHDLDRGIGAQTRYLNYLAKYENLVGRLRQL